MKTQNKQNSTKQFPLLRRGLGRGFITLSILFFTFNSYSQGSGHALGFDGVGNGNAVIIPDNAVVSGGHDLTLESWIYLSPSTSNYGVIMKFYNSQDKDYGVWVNSTTMKVNFTYEIGENNAPSIQGNTVLSTNRFYHIAVTFNDLTNEVRIYVNGILDKVETTISEIPNTPASIKIGKMFSAFYNTSSIYYNSYNFNGQIDEVRIWNKALTQTEIQENMCKKLTGTEVGLVAYYPMDEGIDNSCGGGEDVCDMSGNGNNGTKF